MTYPIETNCFNFTKIADFDNTPFKHYKSNNSILSQSSYQQSHPYDSIIKNNMLIVHTKDIGKKDVLCGRDKITFSHCGNKRFRVVINMHRERYQNTTLK